MPNREERIRSEIKGRFRSGRPRGGRATVLLLFVFFQVLYALFVMPVFPMVGDSADYASLVSHGVFDRHATHIGFYLIHYPLDAFNRTLIGLDGDLFLNLLTTAFGALTVPIVFLLLSNVLGGSPARKNRAALYGAIVYGLGGIVWYHAEFFETPALMLLAAYAALLLFLQGRCKTAGACLALSALVSQAVAPLGGVFLAAALFRRVPVSKIAGFAAAFVLVLLAGVLPVREDFLWGTRGLLSVQAYYPPAPFWKTAFSLAHTMLESYWPLAVLFLFALPEVRRQPELGWMTLASAPLLCSVGSRIGHRDYGVVWLPAAFFAAAWLGLGFGALAARLRRWTETAAALVVGLLFLTATLVTYILPKREAWVRADECMARVYEHAKAGHLIADPYAGYAYAHRFWPELENVWEAPWSEMPAEASALDEILLRGPVFLLDYHPPSHFLREALLENPLGARLLPPEKRAQYVEEFDMISDELREREPGRGMDLVFRCNGARLWRISGDERGTP
ncbi:MAG: hypothetical protein ABIH26_07880 [Candidatus Eisenbacteria bacterium]